MTSKQSVQEFISLTGSYSGLNRTHLTQIRAIHETISHGHSSNRLSQETLRLIAEQLNLRNDEIDLTYLKCCVENVNEESAAQDLIRTFNNIQDDNDRPVRRSALGNQKPLSAVQANAPAATTTIDHIESVSEILCSIYVKQNAPAVIALIHDFFFQQLTQSSKDISG
jgi:hypothetical protein